MRLDVLNDENNPLDVGMDKYVAAKGKGNVSYKRAVSDRDKPEPHPSIPSLDDRSGNQYAVATDDEAEKSMVGATEGDRDEEEAPNISGSAMPFV